MQIAILGLILTVGAQESHPDREPDENRDIQPAVEHHVDSARERLDSLSTFLARRERLAAGPMDTRALDAELERLQAALPWVERLANREQNAQAVEQLAAAGPMAVSAVAAGLGSPDASVREAAAVWLGRSDSMEALALLKSELESKEAGRDPAAPRLREIWVDVVRRRPELAGKTAADLYVEVAREFASGSEADSIQFLSPHVARSLHYLREDGRLTLAAPQFFVPHRTDHAIALHALRLDAGVEEGWTVLTNSLAREGLAEEVFVSSPGGSRFPAASVDGAEEVAFEAVEDEGSESGSEFGSDPGEEVPEERRVGAIDRTKNRVTVYYGTNRDKFVPDLRWCLRRLKLAVWTLGIVCVTWLVLLGILRRELRRTLPWLLGGGLVAGACVAGWGTWRGVIDYQRGQRLGLEYGGRRGDFNSHAASSYCHLGECEVSVPREHRRGEVESVSFLDLLKSGSVLEDAERHFVLLGIHEYETSGEFFGNVKAAAEVSPTRPQAFVFVHGFNVSFEDAARRTAQIAWDLEFPGAPVFFSWPSRAGVMQYTIDESAVEWSIHHLLRFLLSLRRSMPEADLHVIAHSMGNRALTRALGRLQHKLQDEGLRLYQEVVLAAPDIDAETFREDIFPAMRGGGEHITLYSSTSDKALSASYGVHGYPRAGQRVVLANQLESVQVDLDLSRFLWVFELGHSYVGDVDAVLDDLRDLLVDRRRAASRTRLTPIEADSGQRYWRLASDPARQVPP